MSFSVDSIHFQMGAAKLDQIKKIKGTLGRFLVFFNAAIEVVDEKTKQVFYYKINDILNTFVEKSVTVSWKSKILLRRRILEITSPYKNNPTPYYKVQDVFERYFTQKQLEPDLFKKESGILSQLDHIKQNTSFIPPIYVSEKLAEAVPHLKPGDFLMKLMHENYPSIVRTGQEIFNPGGYREASKCTHMAIYLGEMQGRHWIGEATIPNLNDIQVRRIELDDPRFCTAHRPQNGFIVVRNKDPKLAALTAQLAKQYTLKMIPEEEKTLSLADSKGSYKFNFVDAILSLFRPAKLNVVGWKRLLKYYCDYHNKIPFEFMGKRRKFFCSHFAFMMQSLAELKQSVEFKKMIALKRNQPPQIFDQNKKGIDRKISKIWYSLKKSIWVSKMVFRHHRLLKSVIPIGIDAFRTSPQDAVNHMLNHPDKYEIVGQIYRREALNV